MFGDPGSSLGTAILIGWPTFARRNVLLALDNTSSGWLEGLPFIRWHSGRLGVPGGDGAQQERGEVSEGGGFLARDAALREEAKDLGEGTVHAGGGREIAAGGIELGKIKGRSAGDARGGMRNAEQLVLSFGVVPAEGGMNFGAGNTN